MIHRNLKWARTVVPALVGICFLLACGVSGRVLPAGGNPYAPERISDTLTLHLKDFEDCMCTVSIEQGRTCMYGQETVRGGVVHFSMARMPAGPYTAWIRVDTLYVGVRFYKR